MIGLLSCTTALAPPTVRLGDFVVQRAIQQQLYFIAELKNEPVQTWLAKFQGHEHLESVGRKPGAPGNPGSYSAEFGQLRTTPYTAYLSALGDAPDDVVKVEYTAPRRKLSVRAAESNPHHSPLTFHHNPTLSLSLTAHRSPLTAHRSPLTSHLSPSPWP